MKPNQIIQGDTMGVLKTIPDDFVDCIVTSPPYWGLRDYGVDGQIGLEPTLEEYIHRLLTITQELKRVLKPTGTMFFNHGDCYSAKSTHASKSGSTYYDGISKTYGKDSGRTVRSEQGRFTDNIPQKCLVLQNYRLLIRLIDDQGWILRNVCIWNKPNHMPSSVKDRFANSYEPVFFLVKSKRYFFDLDSIREPHKESTIERLQYSVQKYGTGQQGANFAKNTKNCETVILRPRKTKIPQDQAESFGSPQARYYRKWANVPGQTSQVRTGHNKDYCGRNKLVGKNPGDVFTIPTQPFSQAHFATFPEKLITPFIKAGCPEWVCVKCGKARVRITETTAYGTEIRQLEPKEKLMKKARGDILRFTARTASHKTLGWTKCSCDAEFKGGIVLDPFSGAGTTAVVAKKLGRQYLGIELNQDYVKMSERRLANTMGKLI